MIDIFQDEEIEAGTPSLYIRPEQAGSNAEEPEAGSPYATDQPASSVQPLSAEESVGSVDDWLALLRKPRSYQPQIQQAARERNFRTAVAAIDLLLNAGKQLAGGTVRPQPYAAIAEADKERKSYEQAEQAELAAVDEERRKLLQARLAALQKARLAGENNRSSLQKLLLNHNLQRDLIDRRDELDRGRIGLRGEIGLNTESLKQQGRESLSSTRYKQQAGMEQLRQQNRLELLNARNQMTRDSQVNKPWIDVGNPQGGTVGLTKGEALEFFNWLLENGNADQNDVKLMIESFNGSAANNIVQSKVVGYANKYPEALESILQSRRRTPIAQKPAGDQQPKPTLFR